VGAVFSNIHPLPPATKRIKNAIKNIKPVPGRFEEVKLGQPYKVIVDYAHTPDGLQNVLKTAKLLLKQHQAGKLITVFGCGGDRDKGKRPKMGKLSHKYSDISIITSDNPRTEDPEQIIKDILVGIKKYPWNSRRMIDIVEDRHQAIAKAISMAKKGDLVLIAGKGHETYQIVGEQRLHFDDKEEVSKCLAKSGFNK